MPLWLPKMTVRRWMMLAAVIVLAVAVQQPERY